MSAHAASVRGLVKRFGGRTALAGVDLALRPGEVYGLLGPNGAGKSTLIRALVGMVSPDSGSVEVLGVPMPDVAVLSQVGYMTQAAALYQELSVEENVSFFAELYGAREGVPAALDFVELGARRGDPVSSLSGGMRTRVSLACAVVHRPRLLLLDEPTVGVDPLLWVQLWSRLRDLAAGGTAILVSSHVMDEAERCDRLGLLREGRMLAEGTVAELTGRAGVERLEDAFLALSGAAG